VTNLITTEQEKQRCRVCGERALASAPISRRNIIFRILRVRVREREKGERARKLLFATPDKQARQWRGDDGPILRAIVGGSVRRNAIDCVAIASLKLLQPVAREIFTRSKLLSKCVENAN
jgi:hypothetical protein